MSWSVRNRRSYYYRSYRRDGRVLREYVGGGAHGRLAAELAELDRRRRAEVRTAETLYLEGLRADESGARELHAVIETACRAALLAHGFYLHNRHAWRRRGNMQSLKEASTAQELVTISLSGLVSRANGGDLAALARLREYLVENPDLWQKLGDLAWHRHENLLRTIGGTGDQAALLSESVRLKADELRTSLLPRDPKPVHRLAVERVVLSYLELHDLDAKQPTLTNDNAKLAVAYQRARDAAQRRYLAALKTLAALVKLLPAEISRPKLKRPRLGRPTVLKMDPE